MPTMRELATDILQELGVLDATESPSAEDAAVVLARTNRFIEGAGIDRLTIFETPRTTSTITASTQSYTIGSGATINVPRPNWITRAGMIDTAGDPDLEVPIGVATVEQWASVRLKAMTSTWPLFLYYDYDYAASTGYGTITLWPNPTGTTLQLALYLPTPVGTLTDLDTNVHMPPGYYEWLLYRVAVRCAPAFGVEPNPTTQRLADLCEGRIKRANVRPVIASLPRALTGRGGMVYNWRSDQP